MRIGSRASASDDQAVSARVTGTPVATEIEQRTGRRSPATPGKTTGSLRAALNQLYVPPSADLPRLDAYHAGARDDPYEQHSHDRNRHDSQIAAKTFDRHQEDHEESASAGWEAHNRADNFELGAVMRPHNEEIYDDPPRKERRRGLVTTLALVGCVMVGAAGVYAYRSYYVAPRFTQTAAAPSQAEPAKAPVRGYVVQGFRAPDQSRRGGVVSFSAVEVPSPTRRPDRHD
jgi:hypothetical protein